MSTIDLKAILPDDEARSAFLSSVRKEMYDALSLYHDHVKHSLSLMFAVLTAVFAILGFFMKGDAPAAPSPAIMRVFAGSVLVSLFPMGVISTIIISRYYKLYVAALVYAAELHEAVGLGSHAWFEQIREYRSKLGETSSRGDLIRKRTYGWPHSWLLYAILIWFIAVIGLFVGLLILFNA